jgi:hypothetical protein
MRVRHRVLVIAALAGALVLVGGLVMGHGGNVHAQTCGSATLAVNAGGPANVPLARFFGTVTSTGPAIAPCATVIASVGTVTCGTGAANNGSYQVDIQAIGGCSATGVITFTVGGLPASQTGNLPPVSGAVQLNLTVAAATPSPTATAAAAPPPPPPPPPPPTPAPTPQPTARPTAAATTAPTVAPTVAPTAVVPARPPQTGLGGAASQQKPSGPAVVTAQKPSAPAAAAPALPRTGTGGWSSSPAGVVPGTLALAGLAALLGAFGIVLANRRL